MSREKLKALEELQKVDIKIRDLSAEAESHPARLRQIESERNQAKSALDATRGKLADNERARRTGVPARRSVRVDPNRASRRRGFPFRQRQLLLLKLPRCPAQQLLRCFPRQPGHRRAGLLQRLVLGDREQEPRRGQDQTLAAACGSSAG